MFCTKCGRKLIEEKCTCLNSNSITRKEWIIVFVLMMTVPVFTLGFVSLGRDIFSIQYLFYGNIGLILFLLVITLLHFLLKRPYLPLIFGCHQRVERTIMIFQKALPLCARCTGIYVGIFLSLYFTYTLVLPWYVVVLLALPLVIDGFLQKHAQILSNNTRRFLTGILFSVPFVYLFALFQATISYGYQALARWIIGLF